MWVVVLCYAAALRNPGSPQLELARQDTLLTHSTKIMIICEQKRVVIVIPSALAPVSPVNGVGVWWV